MKKVRTMVSALLLIAILAVTLPIPVNAATLNGSSVKRNAVTIPKFATTYTTSFSKTQKGKWYKFKAQDYYAGYRVIVKNVSLSKEILVYLYDSSGNIVDWNPYSHGKSFDEMYKLKKNKWYYLEIENTYSVAGTVSFSVSVRKDYIRDSKAYAKVLTKNQTYRSSLDGYNDVDYFKFKPTSTGDYTFVFNNERGKTKEITVDYYGGDFWSYHTVRVGVIDKDRERLVKGRWYYIMIKHGVGGSGADYGYYKISVQ